MTLEKVVLEIVITRKVYYTEGDVHKVATTLCKLIELEDPYNTTTLPRKEVIG